MGNTQQSSLLKQSKYSIIKSDSEITHLFDNSTKEEYLALSFNLSSEKNTHQYKQMKYLLQRRKKIGSSSIPILKTFQEKGSGFCSNNVNYNLVFHHPYKSLAMELKSRKEENEVLTQGQIWTIAYSCLQALNTYQKMSINVKCSKNNVYISKEGHIILSDSNYWLKVSDNSNIQKYENIDQLSWTLREIMGQFQQKVIYSEQIQQLIKKLSSGHVQSVQKGIKILAQLRKLYEEKELKNQKQSIFENISFQYQQMIPTSVLETYKTSSNEENISQIFSEKMSSILPLITPKNSMIEDSSILLDLNSNPQIFVQKQKSPVYNVDVSKKVQTIPKIEIHAEPRKSQKKTLSQKNRQVLQNLINNQQNIILQVSKSQYQTSTIKSGVTHYRSLSKQTNE